MKASLIRRAWDRSSRFVREITTGTDNHTSDLVRLTGLSVAIQFIWLSAAN